MRILVTGSSGHLGEALMRLLPEAGHTALGLDIKPSPFTTHIGSITDPALTRRLAAETEAILHTATLHKPHVATHSRQDFVDTNITGTLTLLEAATMAGHTRFIFTSTTSAFGDALRPAPGAPAAWIDEAAQGVSKNIYGA
ncbi:MAG: NAD(P)-dependent oxidoreductase, partial [Pseudomonadota bacterium]